MGILEQMFCDFVCWTTQDMFIEWTYLHHIFFEEMEVKLKRFLFQLFYPHCYCQKGEESEIVLHDFPGCQYGWFHFSCVNLASPPTGAWFCPDL